MAVTRTLVITAVLWIVALAPSPVAQRSHATLAPRPTGLIAGIKDKPGKPFSKHTFDNAYIVGVAIQIHWDDIERTEESPDWSRLDSFVSEAASAGKWAQISLYAGFFTPAWALQGVKTDRFAVQYGPEAGLATETQMTETVISSTFGQPVNFVDPCRAMLGVRLHLGR